MKFAFAALGLLLSSAVPAATGPAYTLSKSIALGTPDRWDYVVFDPHTDRVYVAHGDRLAVIDPRAGKLVGEVQGISGGTHGTAISARTGQGFTDDGRNGKAVAFDPRTLKVLKEIPADVDADALALDPVTGHLFVAEGDPAAFTVIDTRTDLPIAKIKAGEKLEYAVADGRGAVYVAGNGNGDLLKVDARSNRIVKRWPTAGCESPRGLAVDIRGRRAFMGCGNSVLMVVDTRTGRTVAKLPIGKGSDAVAFDPNRKRLFSSNGSDGTVTAYQQVSPDRYRQLPTIGTLVSARTMSVDPATGQLFVAGADTDPSTTPSGRPHVRPGTLRLLIFDPRA